MAVSLPLKKMTVAEKLRVMEELWEDLSRDPDAIKSPAWHGEILKERKARIAAGKSTFKDWEKAKADIRRRAR